MSRRWRWRVAALVVLVAVAVAWRALAAQPARGLGALLPTYALVVLAAAALATLATSFRIAER